MVKKIYLVRHGKIDSGREKRYIGITDIPLDKDGKAQAMELNEYFSNIKIAKAYTSPLIRCIETSKIILKNKTIEAKIVDELREINMGKWEYKTFAYIKERFPEEFEKRGIFMDSYVPPEGESFKMLQRRVLSAFYEIVETKVEDVLIVAHAGVNRVIISKLMSWPLANLMKIKQPYGCINILVFDKGQTKWELKKNQRCLNG